MSVGILQKAYIFSLPCQHVFCKDCLLKIDPPACPNCRAPYEPDLDGTEHVTFTATEQWDILLELAQDWAILDKHGAEDEPEGTDEEDVPFIDNEDHDARYGSTGLGIIA